MHARLTICCALLLLVSCGEDPEPGDKSGGASSASTITFEPVSFSAWEQKRASFPPDVVVVDMWATWCVSCLERFPHMVTLWQRYREQGVRFVSLNLDDHEDLAALQDARQLLERFGARFENYYMDENLMQAFARLDLIGIPAVLIYDRDGREAARLTGDDPNKQFTDQDVENQIRALLAPAGNSD